MLTHDCQLYLFGNLRRCLLLGLDLHVTTVSRENLLLVPRETRSVSLQGDKLSHFLTFQLRIFHILHPSLLKCVPLKLQKRVQQNC